MTPRSATAEWKTLITAPLLSSQRAKTDSAKSTKSPHQVQPFGGQTRGYLVNDGPALRLQIVNQRFPVVPVHKRARPCNRSDTFPNLVPYSRGASAPASSRRGRRFAGVFPSLISISSRASRVVPRASRLAAISAFDAMPPPRWSAAICITGMASRRPQLGRYCWLCRVGAVSTAVGKSHRGIRRANGIPTFRSANEVKPLKKLVE
jgi:hypothetical protein